MSMNNKKWYWSTVSSRIEWLYVVRNMDLAISQITNVYVIEKLEK